MGNDRPQRKWAETTYWLATVPPLSEFHPDETMTDASDFFEFSEPSRQPDEFETYGGKDARLRVIPVVRKNRQTNPRGLYINCTSSGTGGEKDRKSVV